MKTHADIVQEFLEELVPVIKKFGDAIPITVSTTAVIVKENRQYISQITIDFHPEDKDGLKRTIQ